MINISSSTNHIDLPEIASTSGGINICGSNGTIVLQLTNDIYSSTATFQWFKNGSRITVACNTKAYIATDSGEYRIMVIDGVCSSISDLIKVTKGAGTIYRPTLAKRPTNGVICEEAGSVTIYVSNAQNYTNVIYN
jgi:hypothetical protein